MISIFVAGTVELSGSKSPIVAMAEVSLITSFESLKLSVKLEHWFSCGYNVFVPFIRDYETENVSAGSGCSSCCCCRSLERSWGLGGIPEDDVFIHGERGEREIHRSTDSDPEAPLLLISLHPSPGGGRDLHKFFCCVWTQLVICVWGVTSATEEQVKERQQQV